MDATTKLLEKLMDACTLRHRVLASNLANAETPEYKRKDVSFSKALAEAINTKDMNKLAAASPEISTDTTSPVVANGNNVSTQKELALMLENSLLYDVSVTALSRKFAGMRKAIRGN